MKKLTLVDYHSLTPDSDSIKKHVRDALREVYRYEEGRNIDWKGIYGDLKGVSGFELKDHKNFESFKNNVTRSTPLGDRIHYMSLLYWLLNCHPNGVDINECRRLGREICDKLFHCSIEERYLKRYPDSISDAVSGEEVEERTDPLATQTRDQSQTDTAKPFDGSNEHANPGREAASGNPLFEKIRSLISRWYRVAIVLFASLLLVLGLSLYSYDQWQTNRELHATYPELAAALEEKLDDLRGTGKLTSREFAEEYVRLGGFYSVFDLDQSQRAFRNALIHEPSLPSALLGLGNYYKEKGLTDKAVLHFTMAANSNSKDDPLQIAAIASAKMMLAVRRFKHDAAVEFAYEADRALQLHSDEEFRLASRMFLATVVAADGDLKGGARLMADAVRDCKEVRFPRLLAYCRQMDFMHVREGTSYNEVRRIMTETAELFRNIGAPIQAIRLESQRELPPTDTRSPDAIMKWAEANYNEAKRMGAKVIELHALRQRTLFELAFYRDYSAAFATLKTVITDIDAFFEFQTQRAVLREGASYAVHANELRQALKWVQDMYSIGQSIKYTEGYLPDLFWMTILSEAIGDTEAANMYWMQLEKQVALQLPDGGQSAQLVRLAGHPYSTEYPGLKLVLKRIIAFAENEQDAESAEAARKLLRPNEKAD